MSFLEKVSKFFLDGEPNEGVPIILCPEYEGLKNSEYPEEDEYLYQRLRKHMEE